MGSFGDVLHRTFIIEFASYEFLSSDAEYYIVQINNVNKWKGNGGRIQVEQITP